MSDLDNNNNIDWLNFWEIPHIALTRPILPSSLTRGNMSLVWEILCGISLKASPYYIIIPLLTNFHAVFCKSQCNRSLQVTKQKLEWNFPITLYVLPLLRCIKRRIHLHVLKIIFSTLDETSNPNLLCFYIYLLFAAPTCHVKMHHIMPRISSFIYLLHIFVRNIRNMLIFQITYTYPLGMRILFNNYY